MDSL
jgi:hypothetical protein